MLRGVQLISFGAIASAALIALAGCGHNFYGGEREGWRREAEVACLTSGAVKESPSRVRISPISGPGICGADYPIQVSALGDSGPLGYIDEPVRPPAGLSSGATPQHWPVVQSAPLPADAAPGPAADSGSPVAAPQGRPSPSTPAQLGPMRSATPSAPPLAAPAAAGRPMSLYAPGVQDPREDDAAFEPEPPRPYGGSSPARGRPPPAASYGQPAMAPPPYTPGEPAPPAVEEHVPLGPPRDPGVTASIMPVEVKPTATLACPLVSALDQWITTAVQPAALRWFHQPVVEIKQISAYSCRGMNGNPNAHISEHAFGNALDIAAFALADGHKVTVQYGWHGSPEEQGFLHDVQLAACNEFSTVLAPGANIYHYNHIHVDLMRRYSGRRICQPAAIPGEVVAERVRALYASHGYGDPNTTGSISKRIKRALGLSGDDDDRLPLAVPGED
jgi:Extensin-like protein C-terminus